MIKYSLLLWLTIGLSAQNGYCDEPPESPALSAESEANGYLDERASWRQWTASEWRFCEENSRPQHPWTKDEITVDSAFVDDHGLPWRRLQYRSALHGAPDSYLCLNGRWVWLGSVTLRSATLTADGKEIVLMLEDPRQIINDYWRIRAADIERYDASDRRIYIAEIAWVYAMVDLRRTDPPIHNISLYLNSETGLNGDAVAVALWRMSEEGFLRRSPLRNMNLRITAANWVSERAPAGVKLFTRVYLSPAERYEGWASTAVEIYEQNSIDPLAQITWRQLKRRARR